MPLDVPTPREIESRIVLRLAGRAVPLTDLTPVSVTRMLIRSMVVEEFAALWRGLAEASREWFIDTATGDRLDRRLADFGLSRPGAVPGVGTVTVTVDDAIDLPAGTIFRTAPSDGSTPKRYRVASNTTPSGEDLSDGSWHITDTREVQVEALVAGQAGNTAAGSIVEPENPVPHLTAVTNPTPVVSGRDALGDQELREYFASWLRALSGGTRGTLLHRLDGYTDPVSGRRVRSVALQEWGGQSLLSSGGRSVALIVYVDEGLGGGTPGAATAHSALVAAVQRLLDGDDLASNPGIRAAGVPVAVEAARSRLVDIEIKVSVDARYDAGAVAATVRANIISYIARVPVAGVGISGELSGQLSLARLFRAVVDTPGVLQATITNPTADVPVPIGMKVLPREIALTVSTTD